MPVAKEDVLRAVRLQLGRPVARESDRLIEELGAESVDILNLVASLEQTYRIRVPEAQIAELRTVGDLHALLDRLT
jgi:acyl carrier protein